MAKKKETWLQVYATLRDYPETRNSDALLMIMLWQKYYYIRDGVSMGKLLEVMQYSAPSSIIRARTEIQNVRKEFEPTSEEVKEFRKARRKEMHEIYKFQATPEYFSELNRINKEQKLI